MMEGHAPSCPTLDWNFRDATERVPPRLGDSGPAFIQPPTRPAIALPTEFSPNQFKHFLDFSHLQG